MDYTSCILSLQPKHANVPILIDADRPSRYLTLEQYKTTVKSIAVGLQLQGINEQDGIGLLSDNDIYYHLLGDAIIAAGAVSIPIPTFNKQADLGNCIRAGLVKYLFAAEDYLQLALDTFSELGLDSSRVFLFDPPGVECSSDARRFKFSELIGNNAAEWTVPDCIRADPEKAIAQRLFTSGTTGTPKAAEISNACCMRRFQHTITVPGAPVSRFLHYIPIFHPSGISSVMGAVKGALVLYLTSTSETAKMVDLIQKHSITRTMMTPYVMGDVVSCIQSGQRSRDALQSLRAMSVGGSASRGDVLSALTSLVPNIQLANAYGSTEAHIIAMSLKLPAPPLVGEPREGTELKIIDFETTETLGEDKEGEICCRTPYMFSGYCNDATATASAFLPDADGRPWIRTGDKGFIDSTTRLLAITGRFKEIFKVGVHEDVAPTEIEEELLRHPAVADAAISSIQSRYDENIKECIAYVVRKDGQSCSAQDIVQYVASRMARFKVPTGGVIFVAGIPRNAMQKKVKRKLDALPQLAGSAKYLDIID